ncbi:hypothetical protein CFIO01_06634 [Colletotrichum fioriniae PJ7]|uniref:Uncharacterized protein n=1 Tax=Colletotrichum fioriniae PJ7 TaxID=1445577 RepID=A0A010Q8Q1_9PEZI|nr:hypothetical protein CFIO01_06634 [Colletotrichum fioriniae PJ7]
MFLSYFHLQQVFGHREERPYLTTFECSLLERLSAQMQEQYTAQGQIRDIEEQKMPVVRLRLSKIQDDIAFLERQIETETRGRAAAKRRQDELKGEKEELGKVIRMAQEGVKVAEVSRMAAVETAAEIRNDIKELHGISGRAEKDQWIHRRLQKHADEEKLLRAQAEAMFGPNWEKRVTAHFRNRFQSLYYHPDRVIFLPTCCAMMLKPMQLSERGGRL